MSTKQKHDTIRKRLATLGYTVRSVNGFHLSIVRKQSKAIAA